MKVWYAAVTSCQRSVCHSSCNAGFVGIGLIAPLRSPLISVNFVASSNFRKSFVFCANSLRCTVESR